jgi:hypothetical protein
MKVTMVEKGPHIDPARDFRQTQDPKYIQTYLKATHGRNLSLLRTEGLGGGSGFYEAVSLRAPSLAFEAVDGSGERLWPSGMDRAALDPFYDMAEDMLHVAQIAPERVPRTGLVFARLMDDLGYTCERSRFALRGCIGSGFCITGCIYGAKQSLLLNYLPQAVAAGATIETDLEAVEITALGDGDGPPYLVRCRSRGEGGEEQGFCARIVVLAGGTVGTAALLMRSKSLRALSAHLGRNIGFNGSVKVAGLLPDHLPDTDLFAGPSIPGMISYHFLESHGITVFPANVLPLQLLASARLSLSKDGDGPGWWGAEHSELMKQVRHRLMVLVALGLTPSTARITRGSGDRFDLRVELTDEIRRFEAETSEVLRSILRRNGCQLLEVEFLDHQGRPHEDLHFSSGHPTGSCRMADWGWWTRWARSSVTPAST